VTPIAVVVARSPGIAIDASVVLQQLFTRFGGRGGGKPDLAQGAGLVGAAQDIVTAARELLGTPLIA
jgi:alanyl-tRNA synthetase